MSWFGFGFNAFGQILGSGTLSQDQDDDHENENDDDKGSSCFSPVRLEQLSDDRRPQLSATWSRTAWLSSHGEGGGGGGGRVFLSGSGGADANGRRVMPESPGCVDAVLGDRYLTLGFKDRVACWDLRRRHDDPAPAWSMEMPPDGEEPKGGASPRLPLVPGGYIASRPPFYRPLAPQLKAVSLALGAEHAVLLSSSGTVYTWGTGSHGQLGHSGLTPEKEPRPVEALWGVRIDSVATGGWHSACVSAGGDLYVWGWNESGQLGLPSQALRTSRPQEQQQQKKSVEEPAGCQEAGPATSPAQEQEQEEEQEQEQEQEEAAAGVSQDVFISIQAFPALLDVAESCDVAAVSCGSRHTAAVTTTGDLYTWGWGVYGQLGHGGPPAQTSDEPHRVDFFRQRGWKVLDVVCGPWNTFAMATEEEEEAEQS